MRTTRTALNVMILGSILWMSGCASTQPATDQAATAEQEAQTCTKECCKGKTCPGKHGKGDKKDCAKCAKKKEEPKKS